ncbi:MAG: hypothetical protein WDW38_004404 [Sanguina aurantia]
MLRSLGSANLRKAYAAYTELHCTREQGVVRFGGVYTDGGIDDRPIVYWCDNMFSPFQWAPYCSEATSNAACVALLQRNPVADTVLLQHRTFLIERLAYAFKLDKSGNLQITAAAQSPAQRAAVTRELTSWKTNGLQTYFQQLFHAMNAGHAPGLCMLQGLEGDGQQRMVRESAAEQTLHHTYLQIENLAVLGSCYALTALEESYQKLVEREALTRFTMEQSRRGHAGLGSPTPDTVPLAIISAVAVNRGGGSLSCPVRCGFISVTNLQPPHQPSHPSSSQHALSSPAAAPANACSSSACGSSSSRSTAGATESCAGSLQTDGDTPYGVDRLEHGIRCLEQVVADGAMCRGKDAADLLRPCPLAFRAAADPLCPCPLAFRAAADLLCPCPLAFRAAADLLCPCPLAFPAAADLLCPCPLAFPAAAEVLEDVRRGRLPPILQHVQARNGEWIEFQAATPSDHPSPGSAGSHPASTTPPASSDPSVTRRPPFRRDVEPHHVALVMAEAAVAEVRSAASASGGACWDATAPRAGVARSWPVLWFRDRMLAVNALRPLPAPGLGGEADTRLVALARPGQRANENTQEDADHGSADQRQQATQPQRHQSQNHRQQQSVNDRMWARWLSDEGVDSGVHGHGAETQAGGELCLRALGHPPTRAKDHEGTTAVTNAATAPAAFLQP